MEVKGRHLWPINGAGKEYVKKKKKKKKKIDLRKDLQMNDLRT